MILGLMSRGDDDVFRDSGARSRTWVASEHIQRLKHEDSLASEVDSKWAAKPLALNRTKGERSSNSKTLAVSSLDRILKLGLGRPLNLSPSCFFPSSQAWTILRDFSSTIPIFETPEEMRDRVVEAFDYIPSGTSIYRRRRILASLRR